MRVYIYFAIILTLQGLNCDVKNSANYRLNYFDIDLLRYSAEDKKGNVMVSPASIKSTLAMLLEGAEGETAQEIRRALRLSPMKRDWREELNNYLYRLEANSSGVLLQNANAVFVSNKLKVKQDYEKYLQNAYYSEIVRIDFKNTNQATQLINGWVNKQTRGLIPFILTPADFNPLAEMIVTNALFFKGLWRFGFDRRLTRGACFYNKGQCQTVEMMDLQAKLNYAYVRNLRAHALELPYQDTRYSMILLVPVDRDGIYILTRDLPYMSLPQIAELMTIEEVRLSMPKFTVDYSEDMVATLKNMRINALFSTESNLSSIFEGTTPYVNNVFHKVYMSVDEEGTVAAAATGAMVIPLINDSVDLRVDRPFVFFIRDNASGAVLFEGKIEEPNVFEGGDGINVRKLFGR